MEITRQSLLSQDFTLPDIEMGKIEPIQIKPLTEGGCRFRFTALTGNETKQDFNYAINALELTLINGLEPQDSDQRKLLVRNIKALNAHLAIKISIPERFISIRQ